MKCNEQDKTHGQDEQSTHVDDACIQAADEILYKLSMLKRERITLINLAHERTQANLPINSPEVLAQAEKINLLLEDEAIRELFMFLRKSSWAQSRLDIFEFKQSSLVLASLNQRDAKWLPVAYQEFHMFQEKLLQRLLTTIKL